MMKKKALQTILLFGLSILTLNAIQAQPVAADDAIDILKNGALIMRLPSNAKKIAALEDIISRNEDPAAVRRATKLMEETQAETREENQRIIRFFREFYKFSAVYFMYDTSLSTLAGGARRGIFLRDDLSPDPTLSLPNDQFLLAQIGYTDQSSSARAEALIITGLDMKPIQAPFPSAIRYNTLSELFGLKDTARERQVKLLNKKLGQYNSRKIEN